MSTNSQSIVKTRMMFKEEFEKLRKIKMRLFISLIFIYFGVISAMILFGLYYLKTKNVRWFYVFLFSASHQFFFLHNNDHPFFWQ